jgi:hypothetical protein
MKVAWFVEADEVPPDASQEGLTAQLCEHLRSFPFPTEVRVHFLLPSEEDMEVLRSRTPET